MTGPAEPRAAAGAGSASPADPGTGPASGDPAQPLELTETALEALLFVAERPLSRREIAALAGVDRETVDARLGDLEISLAGRGIRLLGSGDRVELATSPEAGPLVARYIGADAIELSPAALETLAIVAYRQPVTKAVIERIRGVDSDYTVRVLVHRRLVVELGRAEAPGRPILYGTAFDFLERFGLASLEDLPPLDADVAGRLVEAAEADGAPGLRPDRSAAPPMPPAAAAAPNPSATPAPAPVAGAAAAPPAAIPVIDQGTPAIGADGPGGEVPAQPTGGGPAPRPGR